MRGRLSDRSAAEWVKFIPPTWEHLIGNEVIYSLMKQIEKAFSHIMIKNDIKLNVLIQRSFFVIFHLQ